MPFLFDFARWAPWVVLAFSALVLPVLLFIPAPYGRHLRAGWGPTMPAKLGWFVMELPSFALFGALLFTLNPWRVDPSVLLLGALWLLHYGQRTLVFPLLMRGDGKRKPVLTVVMAIVFNLLNASGNALQLEPRGFDLRFFLGVAIFLAGFGINLWADAKLRNLRKPGDSGYQVPRGGLYELVSCPNYFGELLEWTGFALAAWTLPALAFAVFTFANLFPRALAHHRWYRATFADYPASRRAVLPFVA